MKNTRQYFVILLMFALFYLPTPAQANSLDSFNLVAEIPENQLDQKVTYFDLLLKPDEKQTLTLRVTNRLEEELPLEISFNKALTNGSGVVEYAGNLTDQGTFALPNIEDLVTVSANTLTLAPKETQELQLKIHMPKEAFKGLLAGGIYVKQVEPAKSEAGNVTNLLSREIALLLRVNKEPVAPELKVVSATAQQANARNGVIAVIENVSGTYVSDVAIKTTITKDGKEVISDKKEGMKIAPSSQFPYRISLAGQAFKEGTYEVALEITAGEQSWSGTESFTIEPEVAASFNRQDVTLQDQKSDFPWSSLILVSVLLIFMLVLWRLLRYNRQLKAAVVAQQAQKKKGRKRKKRTA